MRRTWPSLHTLDLRDPGRAPAALRMAWIGLAFVAVTAGGFWVQVARETMPLIAQGQRDERQLKATFEERQRLSADLQAQRDRLAAATSDVEAALRGLYEPTRLPALLAEILQAARAAGLEERLFQPGPETVRDFHAELPIRLRLVGAYHDLAAFVAALAGLPYLVTLHEAQIQPESHGQDQRLVFEVTARAYRRLDEPETRP